MFDYRRVIMKWFSYGIMLFISVVLQVMVLPRVPLWGAHALTGVVAVIVLSVFEGPRAGAIAGFLCGLLLDAAIPPGEAFFTIFLMASGALTGAVVGGYFHKTFWTAFLWSAGALTVMQLIYFYIFYYATGRAGIIALYDVALPEILLSFIAIPPFYGLFYLISRGFREKEIKIYL